MIRAAFVGGGEHVAVVDLERHDCTVGRERGGRLVVAALISLNRHLAGEPVMNIRTEATNHHPCIWTSKM
ncbi:MAG: hypothetical protein KJP12_00410 [Acidimicrobiia bacterium]|nr:hypothetical protein [Acidimicrobiia bacterium]